MVLGKHYGNTFTFYLQRTRVKGCCSICCIIFYFIIAEIKEELHTGIAKPMEDQQNTEKCSNEPNLSQENDCKGEDTALKTERSENDKTGLQVFEQKEKVTDQGEITNGTQQPETGAKMEPCKSLPELDKNLISGTDLFGYVGIEAVLDQIKSKTVKAGFEFNLMVVGKFSQLLSCLHV